jgi:hypothetical protein
LGNSLLEYVTASADRHKLIPSIVDSSPRLMADYRVKVLIGVTHVSGMKR